MEFSIRKSARSCEVCAVEFVHEQTIHSAVCFSEGDALVRADYCEACWTAAISRAAYSAWTTRFSDPRVAEQQPPELFSPLRRLFYDACASEDRIEQAKAFLAAQLLRRQKVFRQIKESGELDGEVRTTLYTDRIGNQFIEVRDPNFTYTELDEARALLLRALREMEEGAPSDATTAQTASGDVSTDAAAPEDSAVVEAESGEIDGGAGVPGDTASDTVAVEPVSDAEPPLSEAG